MVHTTIESIDSIGREVTPAADLKLRVERAAAVLETELSSVTCFPIESRWRIVHQPGSEPRVELDLTSNGAGVRDWLFDTKAWNDEAQVKRALRNPMWAFATAQSAVVQDSLDRIRQNLDSLVPITED